MLNVWTVVAIFLLFGVIVLIFRNKPEVPLGLLIVSTALNRYRFDVFNAGIRIEHIALLVAMIFLTVQILRSRRLPVLRLEDLLFAIFILVALVSSHKNAPSFMESLKYLLLMGACVCIYFVMRTMITDSGTFRTALIVLVITGISAAFFGILAWSLYPWGINIGVVLYPVQLAANRMTGICSFSPFGTLIEGNIFGSYQASISILFLSFLAFAPIVSGKIKGLVIFSLIGLGISLTRGAWAGFFVGLFIILLFASRRRKALTLALLSLLILVPSIVLAGNILANCHLISTPAGWMYVPTAQAGSDQSFPRTAEIPKDAFYISGLNTARVTSGYTMSGRVLILRTAFSHLRQHLWIGNGANTFAQRYVTSSATRAWISNFPVMLLHDQGILGFTILFLAFLYICRDLYRALKNYRQPDVLRTGLIALIISFVVLLTAYQFTSAFWLGYTWIHLGLLRAGSLIALRQARELSPV